MEREGIRRYQLTQLELLKYVTELCDQLHYRYYLVWGSLLGAIRHGGFIPWDADIDIALFREDYDKLCSYMESHQSDQIFLANYKTVRNHYSPHAVIRLKGTHIINGQGYTCKYSPSFDGVYIDIFPIDNVVSNKASQSKQIRKIRRLQKIIHLKNAQMYGNKTSKMKRALKNCVSTILKPISIYKLNSKMDTLYRTYNNEFTENVAILTETNDFPRQTFKRELFGKGRLCEFEGLQFRIPEKAEELLKITYGDYMQLPPEEDRYTYLDTMIDHVDYGAYGDSVKL